MTTLECATSRGGRWRYTVWQFSIGLAIILLASTVTDADSTQAELSCNDEDLNRLALEELHKKLDDDQDGEVELTETSEFVENEFAGGPQARNQHYQKFHANDSNISLVEMIERWKGGNPGYNWTTDDMVYWLDVVVGLPAYTEPFVKHDVIGKCLPRIALNKDKYLQKVLHITKRSDRSRLKLKAMEVVLFGPVFPSHFWQRLWMVASSLVALVLAGYLLKAREQNQQMQRQLNDSSKLLEEAQAIQDELQPETDSGRKRSEKDSDDDNVSVAVTEVSSDESSVVQIEEIHSLKGQIKELQRHIIFLNRQQEMQGVHLPNELLRQLCASYERETRYFEASKAAAEKRLRDTEESYIKISRKVKNSFLPSSVKLGGGKGMEELDKTILEAKTALGSVLVDSRERQNRWAKIEKVCQFHFSSPHARRKLAALPSGESSRNTSPRLIRGAPKSATFSGASTHWEDPQQTVHRSVSTQGAMASSGSNHSLHGTSSSHHSTSPAKRHIPASSSSHSLKRMPEVDESDSICPIAQRGQSSQRKSDPGTRLAKHAKPYGSLPSISKSADNPRHGSDGNVGSTTSRIRFSTGEDVGAEEQAPESEV